MRVVDEEPQETIHLYVVNEDALPRKPDYPSIVMATLAFLCLLAICGISVFSEASAVEAVSFTISVRGFHLTPVSKTVQTTVLATGKGHTPATSASGIITFYNGLPYTQIVPINTRLTGADGVSVLTDAQAVIPPAAQTSPPTYGQTNVTAHAMMPGIAGNMQAGAINTPCCASAIIAQNPYAFTGGRNARDYTYLTRNDVTMATTPLLPMLQSQTLSILPSPQLNPHCSTVTHSSPGVGKETKSGQLTIVETCSADSYSETVAAQAITTESRKYGKGILTHVHYVVVGISEKRGVAVSLYVEGLWQPFMMRRNWTGK